MPRAPSALPRRPRRLSAGLAAGALAVVLGLTVAACGAARPSPTAATLVRAAAVAMRRAPVLRVVGSSAAGPVIVQFAVTVVPSGAFAGTVEATAPRLGTMRSDVIMVGHQVFVRSPLELARLGITRLPGRRNPATTWVLQPARIAAQYRSSLAPFTGRGLGLTLRRYFQHATVAGLCRVGRVAAYRLVAGRRQMRAVVYVDAVTHAVLRLTVGGADPVVLDFADPGRGGVVAPPAGAIYAPPPLAAAG